LLVAGLGVVQVAQDEGAGQGQGGELAAADDDAGLPADFVGEGAQGRFLLLFR
jgi:hypothetical protein